MMRKFVKIAGGEHAVPFVRFKDHDPQNGGRQTVVVLMDKPYEEVKALFTDPGEWAVVERFDTGEPDIVTDCSDYEILHSITDRQQGVLEVVMGCATEADLLRILLGEAAESKI